jgi:hypothetical protein
MDSKIKDTFITELVLPNDPIACWVKYDESWDFDRIRITYDDLEDGISDFQFKNLLRVIYIAIPHEHREKRIIDIPRAHLILGGYAGFVCKYLLVPMADKEFSFRIDFINRQQIVGTTELRTKVSRPLLQIANPKLVLQKITSFSPEITKPEKIQILNTGSVTAKNIFIRVNSTNTNIVAQLKATQRSKETFGFFKETLIDQDVTLEISGTGNSTIEYITEYSDEVGNHYVSKLMEIYVTFESDRKKVVEFEQELRQKIPIQSSIP